MLGRQARYLKGLLPLNAALFTTATRNDFSVHRQMTDEDTVVPRLTEHYSILKIDKEK